MVIDYDREEPTPQERKQGAVAPKRQLPIGQIAKVADAVKFGDGIERTVEQARGEEAPSVLHAARDGFVTGIAGGLGKNLSAADQLETIAESVEEGVVEDSKAVQERLQRFPELRGIEAPTGSAAKFPELAEESAQVVPAGEVEAALTR